MKEKFNIYRVDVIDGNFTFVVAKDTQDAIKYSGFTTDLTEKCSVKYEGTTRVSKFVRDKIFEDIQHDKLKEEISFKV